MLKRIINITFVSICIMTLVTASGWTQEFSHGKAEPGNGGKTTKVSHTAWQTRPIQLGVSGGSVMDLANGYCCSGTLGALVKDAAGNQYILSNTHVFAGDSVSGGNAVISEIGDYINQPGFVDVNCSDIPDDYIATLTDWMPLVPGGVGTVDAAIAQVIPGKVDSTGKILEIGTISSQTVTAFLNQAVKKSGRTSAITTGKVVGLDATVSVQYSNECAGGSFITSFEGQILISPGKFLKAGDSGSLMVENKAVTPRAVGLLYAGSTQIAIANPIDEVLAAFGVSLVGVAPTAAGVAGSTDESFTKGLAKASEVKARHANKLMNIPNAVGHAAGLSNKQPNKAVIKVLVEKISPETLQQVPQEMDGVPVELWEVGKIIAY